MELGPPTGGHAGERLGSGRVRPREAAGEVAFDLLRDQLGRGEEAGVTVPLKRDKAGVGDHVRQRVRGACQMLRALTPGEQGHRCRQGVKQIQI